MSVQQVCGSTGHSAAADGVAAAAVVLATAFLVHHRPSSDLRH